MPSLTAVPNSTYNSSAPSREKVRAFVEFLKASVIYLTRSIFPLCLRGAVVTCVAFSCLCSSAYITLLPVACVLSALCILIEWFSWNKLVFFLFTILSFSPARLTYGLGRVVSAVGFGCCPSGPVRDKSDLWKVRRPCSA